MTKQAAQDALSAHDRLTAVNATEPDSDEDPTAWLSWHADAYLPAYAAWSAAMDDLRAAGYEGSRHPFHFRPYCEAIIEGGTATIPMPVA